MSFVRLFIRCLFIATFQTAIFELFSWEKIVVKILTSKILCAFFFKFIASDQIVCSNY